MKLNKLVQLYAGITRVNEEERIVEGVAFANETVEGEGGIRLKREAMQAATPDYLRWGAVREMHTASAAGTAEAVDWQEDGSALIRVKVVDDQAWSKVKEGVYKGFSVGVKPRLMRGKNVEACTWVETSLVDRPKDPDAIFTLHRAEGEDGEEYEVEEAAEEVQRGEFAENFAKRQKYSAWSGAQDCLWSLLYDIQNSQDAPETKAARASVAIDEFKAEVLGQISRGEIPELTRLSDITAEIQPLDMISRAEHDTQISALMTRAEAAERSLAEEQSLRTAVEERAAIAETQLAKAKRPVLNAQAIERTFPTLDPQGDGTTREGIQAEIKRLQDSPGATDDERQAASLKIARLNAQLTTL